MDAKFVNTGFVGHREEGSAGLANWDDIHRRLGPADEFRSMQLREAIKKGRTTPISLHLPNVPPLPRSLSIPVTVLEEKDMPKGVRAEPCPECKSKSTRCKSWCPTRGTPRSRELVKEVPAVSGMLPGAPFVGAGHNVPKVQDLVQWTVQELTDVSLWIKAELFQRKAKLEKDLQALEHVITKQSAPTFPIHRGDDASDERTR